MRSTSRGSRVGSRSLAGWLVSLVISAVLVGYLLSFIDPVDVVETLRFAHRPSLMLYVGLWAVGMAGRVLRYWLLLGRTVAVWPLTLVALVRNFAVDLLPARVGSLSYVYLLTTRAGAPVEAGLSSFLLAFVLDAVAIAPLLLLALLVAGSASPLSPVSLAVPAVALLVLSLLALLLLQPALRAGARWLRLAAGRPLAARFAGIEEVSRKLDQVAVQVGQASGRNILVPAFLVSLVIRLAKFGSMYCLLHAVLVPHGYDWGSLPFFHVFLGMAGAELSATLPIHGVAGLGTYEAVWALTFTQLGFPAEVAIVSGFATHLITQVQDRAVGLPAMVWIMRPGFGSDGSRGRGGPALARVRALPGAGPDISTGREASGRKGPRRQGARRSERAGVLVQYVERSNQAQRSQRGPLRSRSRDPLRYPG